MQAVPKHPIQKNTVKESVDIHPLRPQLPPRNLDLPQELLVRFRHIIESEDAPAELEEEVGAEGDESPEGELGGFVRQRKSRSIVPEERSACL